MRLVLSCEHGGNQVPKMYQYLFKGHDVLLNSHRGWDPGALEISQRVAHHFKAPLTFSQVTRLLIELNRSEGHPQHFSLLSNLLDIDQKKSLAEKFYQPYRYQVMQSIRKSIQIDCFALHVSVHTFTPILDGIERQADIGILFDPDRTPEVKIAEKWIGLLNGNADFQCKANYPYLGVDDGFTTTLRAQFKAEEYAGLELEINQKLILMPDKKELVIEKIINTLGEVIAMNL